MIHAEGTYNLVGWWVALCGREGKWDTPWSVIDVWCVGAALRRRWSGFEIEKRVLQNIFNSGQKATIAKWFAFVTPRDIVHPVGGRTPNIDDARKRRWAPWWSIHGHYRLPMAVLHISFHYKPVPQCLRNNVNNYQYKIPSLRHPKHKFTWERQFFTTIHQHCFASVQHHKTYQSE